MIQLYKNKQGFTLIEIMLAMTVFAVIMTAVLLSVQNLSIARIKTENRIKLLEELYYFSEQLVNNIKDGGTIDYEEYWNRKSYSTLIGSGSVTTNPILGSYVFPTGVGNYGSGGVLGTPIYGEGLYYCVSGSGPSNRITSGSGCLDGYNNSGTASGSISRDYTNRYQRYEQYIHQFMDYNSNADGDGGDEDENGNILEDEDDKDLGNAPVVLTGFAPELYLINPTDKTRLYFRYIIRQDDMAFSGGSLMTCIVSTTGSTNEGCVGNIQILKMNGLDIGYNHAGSAMGAFDGKVDTWILHKDWSSTGNTVLGGGTLATGYGNEWIDLFPNDINVKSLQFHIYPQKDPWLSWSEQDCGISSLPDCISPFIHPYVRIQMSVGFAWGKRRTLKNDDPTISINTTVSLGDKE